MIVPVRALKEMLGQGVVIKGIRYLSPEALVVRDLVYVYW